MRRSGGGYTLIELFIVTGVILILAMVLLPLFAAARERARRSTCAGHQHQIALALLVWAENHRDRLPLPDEMWTVLDLPAPLRNCPTAHDPAQGYVFNSLVGGMLVDLPTEPMETLLTADGRNADHLMYDERDLDPRHGGQYLASFVDGHVEPVTPPPAATGRELGQIIEGCGSANFAWLRYPGTKFGIAFAAPKTGQLTRITLQWKKDGDYGNGAFGRYTFALQTDGPGHFPSGTAIATVTHVDPTAAMDGYADGALHVEMTAALQHDTIYHLVITNTDPQPEVNWSSPNTLMTRVLPWDGTGCRTEAWTDGAWAPWASRHPSHCYNTAGKNAVNGARSPLMLSWADGTHTGDPYYSAAVKSRAYFCGAEKAGEFITWNQPTATIKRIGVVVLKAGDPQTLYYHLETAEGTQLAAGPIATARQIGSLPTWMYATLATGVTLTEGQCYRLWFDSPESPDRNNCFFQFVPYGEKRPPEWLECGWGGTASYYSEFTDGAWQERIHADLSFSLQ